MIGVILRLVGPDAAHEWLGWRSVACVRCSGDGVLGVLNWGGDWGVWPVGLTGMARRDSLCRRPGGCADAASVARILLDASTSPEWVWRVPVGKSRRCLGNVILLSGISEFSSERVRSIIALWNCTQAADRNPWSMTSALTRNIALGIRASQSTTQRVVARTTCRILSWRLHKWLHIALPWG